MKKRSSSEKKNQKLTAKAKGTPQGITIGMDLGDKTSRFCMLSNEGQILQEGPSPISAKIRIDLPGLRER